EPAAQPSLPAVLPGAGRRDAGDGRVRPGVRGLARALPVGRRHRAGARRVDGERRAGRRGRAPRRTAPCLAGGLDRDQRRAAGRRRPAVGAGRADRRRAVHRHPPGGQLGRGARPDVRRRGGRRGGGRRRRVRRHRHLADVDRRGRRPGLLDRARGRGRAGLRLRPGRGHRGLPPAADAGV
ncbi:MAG: hypothetical protein AVDCRST_MAG32-1163, partial [uncultured Nocardioides sp.]